MQLSQLLYTSFASQPMTREEIDEIVRKAQCNNSQQLITGLLLYGNGRFMQLLEGDEQLIVKLYNKIAKDSRHKSLDLVVLRPAKKRIMGEWSMGLLNLETYGLDQEIELREILFDAPRERRNEGLDIVDTMREFTKAVNSTARTREVFEA